ncbi:hypothetical protein [Nocardia wallacei]|uniref:hypothetical protein n=1 Tax=Nocardia wallacei TaxID=480035 RepID=UPI002456F5A9|nr:hypothetical protein [Nocardia wallacei]
MRTAFRDPGIPDGEKSVYAVGIADRPQRHELTSVVARETGGYRSTTEAYVGAENLALTIEQRFQRTGEWLRAQDYLAETRSGDTVVSREEAHFVDTTHLRLGGDIEPFPPNVMPLLGGMTLLRGLDFTEGATESLELWLAFSLHWPLTARVDKQLVVEVPAGSFTCWQVLLRPGFAHVNSLLDKMIGGLLPPSVAHFEAAPPHRLVRFGFPTQPMPSAPRGLIELVS